MTPRLARRCRQNGAVAIVGGFPGGSASEVLILGAGFSRAISGALPLTDELGGLAVELAGRDGHGPVRHPEFRRGSFETWLSRLADDQPHLSAAANLENRSLFLRLGQAIQSVVADRQAQAVSQDAPGWLYELLSVLHARRSTVLTLNYDNLVECAVDGEFLYGSDVGRWVTSSDILGGLPPLAAAGTFPGGGVLAATFRLLKLHGSLSWFWSPDDVTGATLQRWVAPGRFGAPETRDEDERRRVLPGREPFIVPPAAVKSSYFRNLITRELWSRAFEALAMASRVIMIGYSLPPGDLTLTGMIGDAVSGRDVAFEIVNPDPGQVRSRLHLMGVADSEMTEVSGPECVERFVCRYRDEQAHAVVRYLREWARTRKPEGGTLVVSWINPEIGHPHMVQPVAAIEGPDDAGNIMLSLPSEATMLAPNLSQLADLIAVLPGARRLVARTARGRHLPIVDLQSSTQPGGNGLRWVSLVPAGRPGTA
jgi:hypothetical protein